ncbi:MAG: DUF262 domain-containing HNH endonuclease family protein [Candidatus Dadabacteria bacterium]|nr:DUF262 domain-containing HNH endonuclease family protein [Candidatus Dadabacteria bacterium]
MSDFMLMEPANQSLSELLGNAAKYTVPHFQRDYSWEQEQWEDLWADIENLEQEGFHYMGYIVLQRKSQNDFEVIDGQQRLVTLSLLILAAMQHIQQLAEKGEDAENNENRLEEITRRYIGPKDIVSLRVSGRLTLNRNNGRFYKDICSNLRVPQSRGITVTNRLLSRVFEFFCGKNMGSSGEEIAAFINKFSSRLIFTKIVVQDSLNAYKVFETLNARGVQLSTPDLLKNYIFSVVAQNDDVPHETLDDLDETWSTILTQLGENNFTDFVRYHHNSRRSFSTKRDLFKSVSQLYTTRKQAHDYLRSLSDAAPLYGFLSDPYDPWWGQHENGKYREATHFLEGLKLFGIRQPYMVLMTAFEKFTPPEFIKTLEYLYCLSIRYNVICGGSANEQEKRYNNIAMKISSGEFKRASKIKNSPDYSYLYPSDDAFQNAFTYYKMPSRRSSKKIRFLLAEIESKLGHKVRYSDTKLEHICPYNPDPQWYQDFGEGANDIVDRLGNMLLVEKDDLGRVDFTTKKSYYLQTPFKLPKKIAEYDCWDLSTLNNYQSWLAVQAVRTWRVN